jgi:hypothetical protein
MRASLPAEKPEDQKLNSQRKAAMYFEGGYTYSNFLMNMIAIFAFVVWFWLLVVVFGDLFRRHDISGWGKALWVIVLVLFSYLAILAYLITQGRGMTERNAQQAQQTRDELRRTVGFSVADEITKLDQLKKSGLIDNGRRVSAPSRQACLNGPSQGDDRLPLSAGSNRSSLVGFSILLLQLAMQFVSTELLHRLIQRTPRHCEALRQVLNIFFPWMGTRLRVCPEDKRHIRLSVPLNCCRQVLVVLSRRRAQH